MVGAFHAKSVFKHETLSRARAGDDFDKLPNDKEMPPYICHEVLCYLARRKRCANIIKKRFIFFLFIWTDFPIVCRFKK